MQLRRFTTMRTGGTPARYYRPGDTEQLRAALDECRRLDLPRRVLGGGSNLLVDDGPLPHAVIHIHAPGFGALKRTGKCTVRAGAGVPVAQLLRYCRRAGLGGMEFLSCLPGTVGGAVAGNAGAWGEDIFDPLVRLWATSGEGDELELDPAELAHSYRRCDLDGAVVTAAEFELEPRHPELIGRRMAKFAHRRTRRHPPGLPSAGCIFKNPPGAPAGKLLDLCRMKGQRIGGAVVSERHANFIVNADDAAARDVLELVERMRQAVRRRFGIELELEVQHWGALDRVA